MIINAETLLATQIGFRTEFNRAFELATTDHEPYVITVPSTKKKEQYKWMGTLPVMREWLSDAQFDRLSAHGWEIENKPWQVGLEVDREDIEDDQLGLIVPTVQEMGEEARRHPGVLVWNLVNQGFTSVCYDGQFFYDTDHQDEPGGPIQSNRITDVLSAASWQVCKQMMRRHRDAKGRPMRLRPTHLVVPPELETTGRQLLEQETLASGESNINARTATLVVSPYLESPTAWFAFDLSRRLKPFIVQIRQPPQFVAQDNPTDEHAFMRKVYRYSAHARHNAGYALWQFAFASDGTTGP
jgi:phage major head subunit gpT-like protein